MEKENSAQHFPRLELSGSTLSLYGCWLPPFSATNCILVLFSPFWYDNLRIPNEKPEVILMSEHISSAAGSRFGCPGCGSGLRYDIPSGKMICDRCGTQTDVDSLPDSLSDQDMMEVTEFHCPQCGAMVYSADTSATAFCSFCGSDVVLTGKLGKTRRPARIVPFKVSREDCENRYRKHLRHYHLMPNELKTTETISHFRPVYVPFWSYHVISSGAAELKGTKSYTKGNYRYTEDYNLSMHADIDPKGILYDASTAFEDETAAMLQHTSSEAVPFHSAYLSGLYAQAADVPADTYEKEAAASAVKIFMEQVKEEYQMDSVAMSGNINHAFGLPDARFEKELVMLPVWLLAHRQGNRVLYTAVNGQDGRVVCDVPVSNGKIAAVTVILAVLAFLLLSLTVTLKADLQMVLCGFLLLLTQLMFSRAQTVLNNRRTLAFEPDFAGKPSSFIGPAQRLLKRKGSRIETTGSLFGNMSALSDRIGTILVFVLFFVGYLWMSLDDGALSLSGSGGRIVKLLLLGLILIVMVIHVVRKGRKEGSGPLLPRILGCVACGAGVLFLILKLPEDMLYYICSAGMLLAAIWELWTITQAHNEYASRPVPFFQEG